MRFGSMLLIIDLGYLLFYRLHATSRWMSFQKEYKDKELDEVKLLEYFEKHLRSQLDKLKKQHKCPMIFCKDAKSAEVWRKQHCEEYKGTRNQATSVVFQAKEIMYRVIEEYGLTLGAEKLEADDVAYLTVKKIREWDPLRPMVILTSDRDYLQMKDEFITIVDGSGKEMKGSGNALQDKLMKILSGDPSDNIPSVCKGCGKKTAEMLAKNPAALEEYLEKNQCRDAYAKNELLICMEKIPKELVNAFYDKWGTQLRSLVQ